MNNPTKTDNMRRLRTLYNSYLAFSCIFSHENDLSCSTHLTSPLSHAGAVMTGIFWSIAVCITLLRGQKFPHVIAWSSGIYTVVSTNIRSQLLTIYTQTHIAIYNDQK